MSDSLVQNLYCIDREDRIASVNGDWDRFAIANDAPELEGAKVLGRSLWDFVADEMTRHIYQEMLMDVRNGRSISFDFRCDSPKQRRFLEMRISPASNGSVQFQTLTKNVEDRLAQGLYRISNQFSDDLVITCSWCNKIKTAENNWHEVEDAIHILKFFDLNPAPQLSHGMCDECYVRMTAKLKS
ncbi:MAG: PAS domain-containing protein [Pyrinomonadaceae bacterium]